MVYVHEAIISGNGAFPLDMLRYDQCYPVDPEFSRYARQDPTSPFQVAVRTWSNTKKDPFTHARWASFGVLCRYVRYFKVT